MAMDSSDALNLIVYPPSREITRSDFPSDFLFGASTAAYQVEGAALKYGRGMCNWDKFVFTMPEKIKGGANASVAIDHYHRVKEDLKMLNRLGFNTYRFSISWSRILPTGKLNGGVNPEGVKFYHDLIDMVHAEGLEPFVTIFHFDTPLCLEEEYGGFLSSKIVEDLVDFAKICFFEYGDRVKNWITLNEPWAYSVFGYVTEQWPPAVANKDPRIDCYTVAHHLLLGHAHVVHLYRKEFQSFQRGQIGITNVSWWLEPYDPTNPDDVAAVSRALEFMLGWFTAPLVTGDYPPVMKKYVGHRLPEFTGEQKHLLKGSFDFIGLNYYSAYYAKFLPTPTPDEQPYPPGDQQVALSDYRLVDGRKIYIGEKYGTATMCCCPGGFRDLLLYIKKHYGDPIIYITENGYGQVDPKDKTLKNIKNKTLKEMLDDKDSRTIFFKEHLNALKEAMQTHHGLAGARVKGYIVWSIFDVFEWANGYDLRYGLVYVDYNNDLKRYPKNSGLWFMKFLLNNHHTIAAPISLDDGETPLSNKRRRDH